MSFFFFEIVRKFEKKKEKADRNKTAKKPHHRPYEHRKQRLEVPHAQPFDIQERERRHGANNDRRGQRQSAPRKQREGQRGPHDLLDVGSDDGDLGGEPEGDADRAGVLEAVVDFCCFLLFCVFDFDEFFFFLSFLRLLLLLLLLFFLEILSLSRPAFHLLQPAAKARESHLCPPRA